MAKRDRENLGDDDLDTKDGIPDLDARLRPREDDLSENEDLDSEGQPDLEGAGDVHL